MRKRIFVGSLLLTFFLINLVPTSIGAIYGFGTFATKHKVIGKGTASYNELSTKVHVTFILVITDHSEETIEGVGIGQLGFQAQIGRARFKLEDVEPRFTDWDNRALKSIQWSFDRTEKILTIIDNKVGGLLDYTLYLSGTVIGNPGRALRAMVELSGTLSFQAEIVSMEIVANFVDTAQGSALDNVVA